MNDYISEIDAKVNQFFNYQPLSAETIKKLDDYYRAEITYSSVALSGGTFNRFDVTQVSVKGLTVANKPVNELLEVINHTEAWEYTKLLAGTKTKEQLTEQDLLELHRILVDKVDRANSGKYRTVSISLPYIQQIPEPSRVQPAVADFFKWLHSATAHPVQVAFEAQAKLIAIHPFLDGNGRVARLFGNLLLMQVGYSPIAINPNEKEIYFKSVTDAAAGLNSDSYFEIMFQSLNRSLDEALKIASGPAQGEQKSTGKLLKIGQIAKTVGVTVPTIRFWTNEGILPVAEFSKGGYQLYDTAAVERATEIRKLQTEQKMSIKDLKVKFS